MTPYPNELRRTAIWLWERKDQATHWLYTVLTDANPIKKGCLNLPKTVAFNIFTILEQRNLIIPDTLHQTIGNTLYAIPAYKLNFDKSKEWQDLINPPNRFKKILVPIAKYSKQLLTIVITAIITVLITLIMTYYFYKQVNPHNNNPRTNKTGTTNDNTPNQKSDKINK